MSYRPLNQGGSYYDQTRLGYSAVQKNYGAPNRSKYTVNKALLLMKITTSEKSNTCWKVKEKSLRKQRKNSNSILIMKES